MAAAGTDPPRDTRWCGKPRKHGAGPCRRPAGWGTNHPGYGACKLHFGATRNGSKAAARQAAEDGARLLLAREGVDPIDDPLEELAGLAARGRALLDVLAGRINDLDTGTDVERFRFELGLFERTTDRLGRHLEALARLDLDGRRVRVDTEMGRTFAALVGRILDDLALTAEQRAAARVAVPRRLAEVTAGG